jgi:hypothetical protein
MTEGMRRLWDDKTWIIIWVVLALSFQLKYLVVFAIVWIGFTLTTKLTDYHRCIASSLIAMIITIGFL